MAIRPAKISKTLMYWVSLQKKQINLAWSSGNGCGEPQTGNLLSESGDILLDESGNL